MSSVVGFIYQHRLGNELYLCVNISHTLAVLYQYQPLGLTLFVGWATIILTALSALFLIVAIRPRRS